MQSKQIVEIATAALDDLKGKDIVVIDVHEKLVLLISWSLLQVALHVK